MEVLSVFGERIMECCLGIAGRLSGQRIQYTGYVRRVGGPEERVAKASGGSACGAPAISAWRTAFPASAMATTAWTSCGSIPPVRSGGLLYPFCPGGRFAPRTGRIGDNLGIALSGAGFAPDKTISVAVDTDSYYGKPYDSHFCGLPTVPEMQAVCAALSLCHLESAVTERMVRRYDNTIACPRIRIKENSNRTKYMILYLLEDRAVSADFRFRLVFDPFIHADEKRRQDAADLWQKMQQLARGNCAGN